MKYLYGGLILANYAYDALDQRASLYDKTGDTEYTYDGLGRITSVTTYRTPGEEGTFSHEEAQVDTVATLTSTT